MHKLRIKKEDKVFVISGKDRSRTTSRRVLQVMPTQQRILVEGVQMVKRHTKPNPQKNIKGGIVERESPIHVSNVLIVDPDTKKPSRVGMKRLADGKLVRIAKRSGAVLDK